MLKPTSKHKFAIGIYVAILTVIIFVIWANFLKHEIKIDGDAEDGIFKGLSQDFSNFLSESGDAFNKFSDSIKGLGDKESQVSQQVSETFFEKAQEELHKRRTADWSIWPAYDLSFKYPANWIVEPKIPSEGQKLQPITLNSGEQLKIEINFLENTQGLDINTWWQGRELENQDISQITIGGQLSLKVVSSDNRFFYIPFTDQIMEIKITISAKEKEELEQQISDFIQTINFLI